jgi:hypothetical protein
MTETERYCRYFKGLRVYNENKTLSFELGNFFEDWVSDNDKEIKLYPTHNTNNWHTIKLTKLLNLIDTDEYTFSKTELRKRKLQIIKNSYNIALYENYYMGLWCYDADYKHNIQFGKLYKNYINASVIINYIGMSGKLTSSKVSLSSVIKDIQDDYRYTITKNDIRKLKLKKFMDDRS